MHSSTGCLSTIHFYIILKQYRRLYGLSVQLEYHTFLHHSQTIWLGFPFASPLEYHTFLHHSQTCCICSRRGNGLEYHTFLHHSQTGMNPRCFPIRLSTIHFYIILKRSSGSYRGADCLSTIHFYIILKLACMPKSQENGLSTIHFYIILKPQIQK